MIYTPSDMRVRRSDRNNCTISIMQCQSNLVDQDWLTEVHWDPQAARDDVPRPGETACGEACRICKPRGAPNKEWLQSHTNQYDGLFIKPNPDPRGNAYAVGY